MFERQNVVAAVAISLLFAIAAWLRPDPPPSFHAELGRVAAAERKLLNRYAAASADFRAGRIDDPAFADIMERQVLEPYGRIQQDGATGRVSTQRLGAGTERGEKAHPLSFCWRIL